MKQSDRYVKIVEWSEEDQVYVDSAPGLIFGGCHGSDERAVFDGAQTAVEINCRTPRQTRQPRVADWDELK